MDPERWQRAEEILDQALELPVAEREAFAERACAGDAELLREVVSLLRADRRAGEFLAQPFLTPAAGEGRPAKRIGPYRLLRKLGEGGMSAVYLAVREDEQYRRQVAIKVVRSALASSEQLARFRVERQILAGLDHPGIARLYDGGTTEEGLPYFVLEYIEGEPIDEYCDRHRLTIPQRLELFREVLAAVHFAHQNLVVHRDLKPGNILVTGTGTPKLLDFGIAKLLKPELLPEDRTPTAAWLRLMTPDYASPEQVLGKPVTTASDVYSLGLLLYKLLTGRLPKRFTDRSPAEIARTLLAEEPERPSVTCCRPGAEPPPDRRSPGDGTSEVETVSRARRTSPGQLRRQLAGDLDNIVLKALRREPQRRYASAEQFAEDLRRHLSGRTVLAVPDSLVYRLRKGLHRHRLAVAAAVAFFLVVAGAAVLLALQSARLADERDRAKRDRDKAQEVAAFLEEIFEVAGAGETRGDPPTARELLARAARRIDSLADHPETQADLLTTVGRIYREMGAYDQSEPLLVRALELRREGAASSRAEIAENLRELGQLRYRQGAYDDAEALIREGLRTSREAFGVRSPAAASALGDLAAVLQARGRYREAERYYREALQLLPRLADRPPPELPELQNNLATLLVARGGYDEAEMLYGEALTTWRRTLGQNHPTTVAADNNLAALLQARGKYEVAIARYEDVLERQRKLLGDEHPDVALSLHNLAVLLHNQRRFDDAKRVAREALALRRKLFGDAHPDVAQSLNNLGAMLRDEGDYAAAEAPLRESLQRWRELYGGDHPAIAKGLNQLALLEAARGNAAEAEPLFREALAMRRRVLGPDHLELTGSLIGLGKLLTASGHIEEAEHLLREVLDIRRAKLPPNHPQIDEADRALGQLFVRTQRFAEAEPLFVDSQRILGGERAGGRRPGRHGMTWARAAVDPALGTVTVGCLWPCNPYGGDTSCQASLPVLCVRDDDLPNPGLATSSRLGWIGGEVAATESVRGTALTSVAAADEVCASRFGGGWRMAQFHHSEGGWNWSAYGSLPAGQRFWVRISDQPANCWDG